MAFSSGKIAKEKWKKRGRKGAQRGRVKEKQTRYMLCEGVRPGKGKEIDRQLGPKKEGAIGVTSAGVVPSFLIMGVGGRKITYRPKK